MGNRALETNPPNADIHISRAGSDWLWTVFSVMGVCWLIAVALDWKRPRGTRFFHQIAVIVLTTSSVAYFTMASDLGAAPVAVEFRDIGQTRQVWYARYIQWFINFPLLLLALLLLTGLALSDVITILFMGMVVVIAGLVGAVVPSVYKWGYYTFGLVALIYIWFALLFRGPRTTFAADGGLRLAYWQAAGCFSLLLLLYPICWACSEGANVIHPTSEMIWYGVLDILAGPGLLFLLLWHVRSIDYSVFNLPAGKYSDTAAGLGTGRVSEKPPQQAGEGA